MMSHACGNMDTHLIFLLDISLTPGYISPAFNMILREKRFQAHMTRTVVNTSRKKFFPVVEGRNNVSSFGALLTARHGNDGFDSLSDTHRAFKEEGKKYA